MTGVGISIPECPDMRHADSVGMQCTNEKKIDRSILAS